MIPQITVTQDLQERGLPGTLGLGLAGTSGLGQPSIAASAMAGSFINDFAALSI